MKTTEKDCVTKTICKLKRFCNILNRPYIEHDSVISLKYFKDENALEPSCNITVNKSGTVKAAKIAAAVTLAAIGIAICNSLSD